MSFQILDEAEPRKHADELEELLAAVQKLILPYVRAADAFHPGDSPSPSSSTTTGPAPTSNGAPPPLPRTVLVEPRGPEELSPALAELRVGEEGGGVAGMERLLAETLRYSVNTWSRGFLDKLYASTNAVGVVGELVTAVLNTNVHVYSVSPVLTLVEKYTTRLLASLFYPEADYPYLGGISQPGGSASNQTAIVIARNSLFPETKTDGNGARRFILFTSEHGHYSMEKAAQMFGMGSSAVRSVPVDRNGAMRADALAEMVAQSRAAGETPFFVNATAGTTVLGAFDPLDAIADVCERENLWLHIDGSWGGCVAFNAEAAKTRLAGVHRADSVAITPHKMLQVPLTCSFLLGRDLCKFKAAMTLRAGYLFHGGAEGEDPAQMFDLADLTPQCGRRGDSFKLFLSLHYYGLGHYSRLVGRLLAAAEYLQSLLFEHPDFVLESLLAEEGDGGEGAPPKGRPPPPPPCGQVCFHFAPGGILAQDAEANSAVTRATARGLLARGWMVDYAPGPHGLFFRVVVHGDTSKRTVEGLIKTVAEVGHDVARAAAGAAPSSAPS